MLVLFIINVYIAAEKLLGPHRKIAGTTKANFECQHECCLDYPQDATESSAWLLCNYCNRYSCPDPTCLERLYAHEVICRLKNIQREAVHQLARANAP